MAKITDYINSKEIASYWGAKASDRIPFFGETKFPSEHVLGMTLSYIKGSKGIAPSLSPSAFDVKAIALSRQGFEALKFDMPFFKNVKKVDENLRQQLNGLADSANLSRDIILKQIFDDKSSLIESAAVTREIQRMQLLTTGIVTVAGNGVAYTYDFHVPADHKVSYTGTEAWGTATADPIKNINDCIELIENSTGYAVTELLMNSVTFSKIAKSDAVKNAIYVLGQGNITPNKTAVKKFIWEETGCTVYIYNKQYTNSDGISTKFVADNVVVMMPDVPLGTTCLGTTPEESDLMNNIAADVTIVDNGVAVSTYYQNDPVGVETKVSELVLPSFELADAIIIANVA